MPDRRTYADRAEYLKKAVAKRRKTMRQKLVDYKGGSCMFCGYHKCIDTLDFHHKDPSTKSFGLSARGVTRAWTDVVKEADKCVLVCANCHREIHAGILQLPSETAE